MNYYIEENDIWGICKTFQTEFTAYDVRNKIDRSEYYHIYAIDWFRLILNDFVKQGKLKDWREQNVSGRPKYYLVIDWNLLHKICKSYKWMMKK